MRISYSYFCVNYISYCYAYYMNFDTIPGFTPDWNTCTLVYGRESKSANQQVVPDLDLVDTISVHGKTTLVLWKLQSGHDSVHRRTDRQTDRQTDDVKPVYPAFNFVEAGGIISEGINCEVWGDQNNAIQTSCAHKWGQYTPALITTHLIQKYPIIKISIFPESPFSAKYLATKGTKMRLGTQNCIGVKRLTP